MTIDLPRPDVYIVTRILEVLNEVEGGLAPTAVQIKCGINYTQLTRYVRYMVARGLIEQEESALNAGRFELSISPSGRDGLAKLRLALRAIIDEELGATNSRQSRGPRRV